MRILRFAALATSLLLAALSTQLLLHRTLDGFFPAWLLVQAPSLSAYARFVESDVVTLGQWLAILACLLFGLAIPSQHISLQRTLGAPGGQRTRLPWAVVVGMALAAALLLALLPVLGVASWLVALLWVAAILLVLLFAQTLERRRSVLVVQDNSSTPEHGWAWLLGVLALAAFLFAWRLGELPLTPPDDAVAAVLQAQDVSTTLREGPLARGDAGVAYLATATTALLQALPGNPFRNLALSSLLWGLLLVVATWLLACELLRAGPIEEDDLSPGSGRAPPLFAALIVATSLAAMHYARLPLHLEAITWGVAGLWALLRGARLGSVRWITLGGVLTALALLYGPANTLLLIVALIVWAGLALLRRRWLQRANGGAGWPGFGLWLAACAVTAAPLWCVGDCSIQAAWWNGLARNGVDLASVLAALGLPALGAPQVPAALTVIGLFVAPVFLLSIGALVFHLDQMVGWTLLLWMALVVWVSAGRTTGEVEWSTLLAVLPAAALATAFALERLRAGIALSLGGWSRGAVTTLTLGLLAIVGLISWQDYPSLAGVQRTSGADAYADASADAYADAHAAAARWIASTPAAAGYVVVTAAPQADLAQEPLVRLALHGRTTRVESVELLPDALEPGWQVLILPWATESIRSAREAYPGTAVRTVRDLRGNPALYVLETPTAPSP